MNITLDTALAPIPDRRAAIRICSGAARRRKQFRRRARQRDQPGGERQQSAKSAAMDLLAGGKGDVHTVALATQRAELSLELFQQVRNKFVSAYQEIMKMPM